MTSFGPSARLRTRPGSDWLWGGMGLTMAGASAGFAAYMITTAPGEVTGSGSKEFGIFGRFDHRVPSIVASEQWNGSRASARPAAALAIDPEPTGSIGPATGRAGQGTAAPDGIARPDAAPAALRGFVLRAVVDGKALIEHEKRLRVVQPGSILDEAGEVLAIERREGSWVVRTASGVIAPR